MIIKINEINKIELLKIIVRYNINWIMAIIIKMLILLPSLLDNFFL